MDRNMRSTYINNGHRSLPHMGSKRVAGNGHQHISHGSRLSPPSHSPPPTPQSHQDNIIHFVYEAWNKVSREVERGSEDTKYFLNDKTPRQLANFRPFNLEEWWERRHIENTNRKHRF